MLAATSRLPAIRFPKLERGHMLGSLFLAIAAGLYLLAGLSLAMIPDGRADARVAHPAALAAAKAAPPAPEPLQFKDVKPQDAVAINASVPLSTDPNPAARPFAFNAAGDDAARSLECLTAAIYYEAATEPSDGQRAVAQVVLNRVRHPAYPNSVCGVVFEGAERATGCQFTFTCDGSLARAPAASWWNRAREIAKAALAGYVYKPVGWATHYHTNWVVPYWSSSLVKAANVGTHIFYRWEGGWGRAPAFTSRYAGKEPVLPKMRYIGIGGAPEEAAETSEAELVKAAEVSAEGRKIVQRFEPATRAGVAATLAKQSGATAVPESLRWALTGEGQSSEAFGKKAEVAAVEVAAN